MLISNAYRISALFWILSSSSTKFNFQYYFCTHYVQVISSRIYFQFYFDKIFGMKPFEYFNFFSLFRFGSKSLCCTHHSSSPAKSVDCAKVSFGSFSICEFGCVVVSWTKKRKSEKTNYTRKKAANFFLRFMNWICRARPRLWACNMRYISSVNISFNACKVSSFSFANLFILKLERVPVLSQAASQPAMFHDVWIEVNTVHCILKMCFWKVLLVCKILRIHPFVNKMKWKHTNHNINRERTDTNV